MKRRNKILRSSNQKSNNLEPFPSRSTSRSFLNSNFPVFIMNNTGMTTCANAEAQRNIIEAIGIAEYKLKPNILDNELMHRQDHNQDW
ncbi:hypothetical protein BOTCAL_0859g00020 [Botryotinia calthae]|uniref:Uncharacterized protein n=1 Tax=Botryotinia calthae TaxID=38488 RepID=A0A4Y8CHW5_9HELO|nr:hypothetical protein BOTCAL_0859g00020 [Botryotinia calthae]